MVRWVINNVINSHVLLTHATPVNVQIPNPSMQRSLTSSLEDLIAWSLLCTNLQARIGKNCGSISAPKLKGRRIPVIRNPDFLHVFCCLSQVLGMHPASPLPRHFGMSKCPACSWHSTRRESLLLPEKVLCSPWASHAVWVMLLLLLY